MKASSNRQKSPIPPKTVSEKADIAKAVSRVIASKISAVASGGQGQILLEKNLPAVARLLSQAMQSDQKQILQLGRWQRDLGHSPLPYVHLRIPAYRLQEDADSHAPILARRLLRDHAQEKERTAAALRQLAATVQSEESKLLFEALATENEEQVAFLQAMDQRLTYS
ncbi:MAG: hypothetical protein E7585_01155 [Ruminococcaceae bacterium]|nr:hypothetical protein [Oscillospiraceae bacterium]